MNYCFVMLSLQCLIVRDVLNFFVHVMIPWSKMVIPRTTTNATVSVILHHSTSFFVRTFSAAKMTATQVWLVLSTIAIFAFSNIGPVICFDKIHPFSQLTIMLCLVDLFRFQYYSFNLTFYLWHILGCYKAYVWYQNWEFFDSFTNIDNFRWKCCADTFFNLRSNILTELMVGLVPKVKKS